jgi:hypothetical protein
MLHIPLIGIIVFTPIGIDISIPPFIQTELTFPKTGWQRPRLKNQQV